MNTNQTEYRKMNNLLDHLLDLPQLEHKARCEDNNLALLILEKLEEEIQEAVEEAVEKATAINDADYIYGVYNAVLACEQLINAEWYKLEETKETKGKITYMILYFDKESNPYNNQVKLWKHKSTESWTVEANGGECGEQVELQRFAAKGFKEAQQLAQRLLIVAIKRGLQLNMCSLTTNGVIA